MKSFTTLAYEQLSEELTRYQQERVMIARVLETFRQTPLSLASVQPVLDLAEYLNGPMEPRVCIHP